MSAIEDGSNNSICVSSNIKPVAIIGWTHCFNKPYFLVKYNYTENDLTVAKLIPADEFLSKHLDIFCQHIK